MMIGLVSFMNSTEHGYGCIDSCLAEKKRLALQSILYNLNNNEFVEHF